MEIVNEFTVAAEPDRVFATLLDFERVGPCVPGASIGAVEEDGAYPAQIAVRLGPMRLNYRGTVRLTESDEASRHAVMVADVREARGQGSARAQMMMDVSAAGGGSQVVSRTAVELSGRAAQMGAGIVEDVAARLVADMAGNLERLLQDDAGSSPPPTGDAGAAEPRSDGGVAPAPPSAGTAAPAAGPAAPAPPATPEPLRAPPPTAKPISGFRLLLRALWHRLRNGRRASASRAVPED